MGDMGQMQASGRGKLLLFGEHSAVYGYPALGVPLGLGTEIQFRSETGVLLAPEHEKYRPALHAFFRYAEGVLNTGPLFSKNGIAITGSLPPESGLGSSAALCTALAGFLQKTGRIDCRNRDGLWQTAHLLETFFHGTPSGVDTGLSLSKGPSVFYFDRKPLPRIISLEYSDLTLVFGTFPRERSGKSMIQRVKNQMNEHPGPTKNRMDALGRMTEEAVHILSNGQSISELGRLALKAHGILKKLDLSIDRIDGILDLALEYGSPGGKMSGAGGGGAFWFLAESQDQALKLKDLVSERYSCPLWIM